MLIVFDLDIPSLVEEGIEMNDAFVHVARIKSSSITSSWIMIEMLILLNDSFVRGVSINRILMATVVK